MVCVGERRAVRVHCLATCFEEEDEVLCFGCAFGVFPVDVNTVEAEIFDEIDG
jgi:hypothetical protein